HSELKFYLSPHFIEATRDSYTPLRPAHKFEDKMIQNSTMLPANWHIFEDHKFSRSFSIWKCFKIQIRSFRWHYLNTVYSPNDRNTKRKTYLHMLSKPYAENHEDG
ncbi:hypothetical protein Tcan_01042, partial [Toxocara canis]